MPRAERTRISKLSPVPDSRRSNHRHRNLAGPSSTLASPPPTVNVQVRSTCGQRQQIRYFEVKRDTTFASIKEMLYERASIPVDEQILTVEGEEVSDEDTLRSLYLTDNVVIGLERRIPEHERFVPLLLRDEYITIIVSSTLRGTAHREERFELDVEASHTVLQLKDIIALKTRVPPSKLRLKHAGIILSDDDQLSDYGIRTDSFLRVEYNSRPWQNGMSLSDDGYHSLIRALNALKYSDDHLSIYPFYCSLISYWFPPHEEFVISQGPTGLNNAFSIIVTQGPMLVFLLILNPPDTAPGDASLALKYGLISATSRESRQNFVGVSVIGNKSLLCTLKRTTTGYSPKIGAWKEDLESAYSLKKLGVYATKVKNSLLLCIL